MGDSEKTGERETEEARPSIGAYLTSQRRLRGISREELCHATRIPARSLARLEDGAFDEVDDGFVRGFVRTVADALGLDPDDTVARMSEEPTVVDVFSAVSFSSFGRLGVLFVGLIFILISAGLVSVAAQYIPSQSVDVVTVLRRDPVRLLAEAEGDRGFSGVRALFRPAPVLPQMAVPMTPPAFAIDPALVGEAGVSPLRRPASDPGR